MTNPSHTLNSREFGCDENTIFLYQFYLATFFVIHMGKMIHNLDNLELPSHTL